MFPEKVSPNVYTVLFENDEVKVLKVMFELGEIDVMYRCGVIIFYAVSGGKLARTSEDFTINEMDIA